MTNNDAQYSVMVTQTPLCSFHTCIPGGHSSKICSSGNKNHCNIASMTFNDAQNKTASERASHKHVILFEPNYTKETFVLNLKETDNDALMER